jgi:hypothetical protein
MKLSQNQRRAIYVAIVAALGALSYFLADTLGVEPEPVEAKPEPGASAVASVAPSASVAPAIDDAGSAGQGGK